jgi:flavin-binding protein dodecin
VARRRLAALGSAALAGFLVVEFVGSSFTSWAPAAGGALYLASFSALAVTIWGSPADAWEVRTAIDDRDATLV